MRMKFYLAALLFLSFFCFSASISAYEKSQCLEGCEEGGIPPEWIRTAHWDGPKSWIRVAIGTGKTRWEAKKWAMEDAKQKASFLNTKDCVSLNDKTPCNESVNREIAISYFSNEVTMKSNENSVYTVYLLVQISRNPSMIHEPDPEKRKNMYDEVTETPPFSARVFVPGMAQIHKGQKVKGALFITGEALFIGGIAASFGMSSYYKSRSDDKSLRQDKREAFEKRADYAAYAGWAFVGAAAALYIANIIDGAVTPLAGFHLFYKKTGEKIVLAPTATFTSVGLAMNLNF